MPKAKNLFAHQQLNTDDPVTAKKFYKSLFAWRVSDLKVGPGMVYTMIETGSRESGGGIQKQPTPGTRPMWMNYVQVADVKKAMAKAEQLGAQVVIAYQPIPEMGAFGIFTDPTGAVLGVWEPEKKPTRRRGKKEARR